MKILTQLKQETPADDVMPGAGAPAQGHADDAQKKAEAEELIGKALEEAKKEAADKKAVDDKIVASSTPAPSPTAPKPEPKKRSVKEIDEEIKGLQQELESAKNKLENLKSDNPYVQFFINACVAAITGGSLDLGKWGTFDLGMTRHYNKRIQELQEEKKALENPGHAPDVAPDAAPKAVQGQSKEEGPVALAAGGAQVDDLPPVPPAPPAVVPVVDDEAAKALADGGAAPPPAEPVPPPAPNVGGGVRPT
jgi:hypothetical protein